MSKAYSHEEEQTKDKPNVPVSKVSIGRSELGKILSQFPQYIFHMLMSVFDPYLILLVDFHISDFFIGRAFIDHRFISHLIPLLDR